jgi:DNA-binding NarL/FixJ family response regulator
MTRTAIVEEKEELRQYLAELVGGLSGYRCVCTCGSAEEALLKITSARPDVVLMDIICRENPESSAPPLLEKTCQK